MKYRCLTDEELKELEPEFKQFLIVNHVHAEEWEELNKKGDEFHQPASKTNQDEYHQLFS